MSKHSPKVENIYSSACIQALEQEYCSSCSAAVVSSCLVSSHGYVFITVGAGPYIRQRWGPCWQTIQPCRRMGPERM